MPLTTLICCCVLFHSRPLRRRFAYKCVRMGAYAVLSEMKWVQGWSAHVYMAFLEMQWLEGWVPPPSYQSNNPIRTVSTFMLHTTPPKSTKSKNSDCSVSCNTKSNWYGHIGSIWICTEESEFLDLVNFGCLAFKFIGNLHSPSSRQYPIFVVSFFCHSKSFRILGTSPN